MKGSKVDHVRALWSQEERNRDKRLKNLGKLELYTD
jgi:hypothetical protein